MHISTDQLREFHFGLLDPQESADIKAHLDTCDACRAELETIKAQFAALNVLKEQPEASDDIVQSVIQTRRAKKIIPFRTAAILAAAAGVAIIFGILQVGNESNDKMRIADGGTAMERQVLSSPKTRSVQASSLQPARIAKNPPATAEPTLAELRAEKPFAPASNIELNVLPRRDDMQLTIYNAEDLTLVREKRKLTLKRGWNWLQFMWSNTMIDPTSLSLEPKTHADKIEITQLVYPPRLNDLARWTIFSETNCVAEFELTYFTCGIKWKAFYEATLAPDEQSMQLRSFVHVDNGSGEDYEKAQMRLVVGEINLEEKIRELSQRQYPYGDPRPQIRTISLFGSSVSRADDVEQTIDYVAEQEKVEHEWSMRQKEILKQALSEYQLYTIEGRETIPDGWGKRLPSFDVQEIGVTNLYKYDEERWGQNTMRFLTFANTEACKLGENPLPSGYVRVFRNVDVIATPDSNLSSLSYIGAAGIKYVPIGEEVELELGTAQKVKVESKLMRFQTDNHEVYKSDTESAEGFFGEVPHQYLYTPIENYVPQPTEATEEKNENDGMVDLFGEFLHAGGNISGWDETTNWEIEITNARDLPVEVEVTRATGSYYWEVETDDPYQKYDANHLRFTVQLEPRSTKTINYKLTVHHGSRMNNN